MSNDMRPCYIARVVYDGGVEGYFSSEDLLTLVDSLNIPGLLAQFQKNVMVGDRVHLENDEHGVMVDIWSGQMTTTIKTYLHLKE